MSFPDLRSFIHELERRSELVRIQKEVDPNQEITIIQHRVLAAGGPALLFENVKGSPYRLVSNLYGTPERVALALGRPPEEIGGELATAIHDLMPPLPSALWKKRRFLQKVLHARMKTVRSGPVLEHQQTPPKLGELPVLTCWPEDGGPFFTLPLVHTTHPQDGTGNLGIYRLQRYDDTTTGMHWQIEKGGGFHYQQAVALNQPLPISVILGGAPALTLAAIAPLPEGIDERLLAAFLMGTPLEVLQRKTTGHRIPALAEFIFEGTVHPTERRHEGPFGDHLGHYSHSADFPVFRVDRMLSRKDAIYPATVVGKPPQEDFYIGNALQEIFVPLLKAIKPGIADLWSFAETGFHPLAALAVRSRYTHEPLKHALSILGEGQLSLTKVLIVADETTPVRDFTQLSNALRRHFNPLDSIHLLAPTAQDTLDFTGPAINFGSRLILFATPTEKSPLRPAPPEPPPLSELPSGITAIRAIGEAFLMLQVQKNSDREKLTAALQNHPVTQQYLFYVLVSEDVDIFDDTQALWGWFTRFDPYLDLHPARREIQGNKLVLHPPYLIDARWKTGYRKPVAFDPALADCVDRHWVDYGIFL